MFDMVKIGRKIAELRKKNGLTQMGLADAMGISFQAVSNWERGATMPDISKLPELAGILGVSVDELLGASSEAAAVVEKALSQEESMTVSEIAEIAPILPPAETTRRFERAKRESENEGEEIDLEAIVELAPFLDSEVIDSLAYEAAKQGCDPGIISEVAPFMSEDGVAKAAEAVLEAGGVIDDVAELAPFMNREALGKAVLRHVRNGGEIDDIAELAPFVDREVLGEIAGQVVKNGGEVEDLEELAPFLSQEQLGEVVRSHLDNGGSLDDVMELAPFLDRETLGEIVTRLARKKGKGKFRR